MEDFTTIRAQAAEIPECGDAVMITVPGRPLRAFLFTGRAGDFRDAASPAVAINRLSRACWPALQFAQTSNEGLIETQLLRRTEPIATEIREQLVVLPIDFCAHLLDAQRAEVHQ
jgi:hypothetical protein